MTDRRPDPTDALAVPVRIHRRAPAAGVKQRGRDVVDLAPFVWSSDWNFIERVEATRAFGGWVELQNDVAELLAAPRRQTEIFTFDVHNHDAVRPRVQRWNDHADAFARARRCNHTDVALAVVTKNRLPAESQRPGREIDVPCLAHSSPALFISAASAQLAEPCRSAWRGFIKNKAHRPPMAASISIG